MTTSLEQLLQQVDVTDPNLFVVDTHTYRSPNYQTPAQIPVARTDATTAVSVLHKTEGHLAGDMDILCDPNRGARRVSCHGYIPRSVETSRRIYMLVDLENVAWQCGVANQADKLDGAFRRYIGWINENWLTVGTEVEGLENEPFTDWQIVACIWLQIRMCRRFPNMKPDRDHIIGHYEVTRQKSDPQLFPWEIFMSELQKHVGTPSPSPNPAPAPSPLPHFFLETGQSINGAIGTYWLHNGGLPEFGYPVSPEFDQNIGGQVYRVQYFERARLEWQPGWRPEDVTRGRVGAELWDVVRAQFITVGSDGH